MTKSNTYWRKRLTGFVLLLLTISLGACLPPVDEKQEAGQNDGEVIISLTDAPGDFVRYAVNVDSITLTQPDGTTVETVPVSTQVDFAQYVEVSELFVATQVPLGNYIKASMRLNYTDADIWVEGDTGESVQVTSITDETGNPITTLDVEVHFDHERPMLLKHNIPLWLSLDFDLKASNEVSFDAADNASIVVTPLLIAEIDPDLPKKQRVRGPLKSVDVEEDTFKLVIRPFHHKIKNDDHGFGGMNIHSTDDTIYDIDGVSYSGHTGIEAMDQLPAFTAVIVIGDISLHPRRFTAREVYAGSSVPGGSLDGAIGNVISRVDNTLTLRGATLVRAGGYVEFNDEISITLSDTTQVKKQGSEELQEISALSVGQRIRVLGTLIDDNTMDATSGYVRMDFTTINGETLSTDTSDPAHGLLTMRLDRIDGRSSDKFDFSGTGVDAANDADPSNYEVDTQTLSLATQNNGAPVKMRGHVNAFGAAPVDFTATTLLSVAEARAIMAIRWQPGATSVDSADENGIVLNTDMTGRQHHVIRRGVRTDVNDYSTISVLPGEVDEGIYILGLPGSKQVHRSFTGFVAELNEKLDSGEQVLFLHAKGFFDDETGEFRSRHIHIKLK